MSEQDSQTHTSSIEDLERQKRELELERLELENERIRGENQLVKEKPQYPSSSSSADRTGIAPLVLGIISLVVSIASLVLGILALVFAQQLLKEPNHTREEYSRARAGKIMGTIALIGYGSLALLFGLFFFVIGFWGEQLLSSGEPLTEDDRVNLLIITVYGIVGIVYGIISIVGFFVARKAGGSGPLYYPYRVKNS